MISKKPSADPERTGSSTKRAQQDRAERHTPKYVIQRSSETIREWWTGSGWSDDATQALQYSHKPDVSVETLDESAKALTLDEIDD